jgi:hypothetical protein
MRERPSGKRDRKLIFGASRPGTSADAMQLRVTIADLELSGQIAVDLKPDADFN